MKKITDTDIEHIFTSRKPDTQFSDAFAMQLRAQLMVSKTPVSSPYYKTVFLHASKAFSTRLYSGITSALIAIILVSPLTYFFTKSQQPTDSQDLVKNSSTNAVFKQQISSKGTHAFGTLSYITPPPLEASDSAEQPVQAKIAGPASDNLRTMSMTNPVAAQTTSNNTTTRIQYKYAGEPLHLTETQGKVFKRVQTTETSKNQLSHFLLSTNFNIVNPDSFSSTSLETMHFSQSTTSGYAMDLDFKQGTVSIYATAPHTASASGTIKKQDDAALTSMSNEFIKAHGIDVSTYGTPIVIADAAVPTVLYPLLIDSMNVYDQSGNLYGMTVVIDATAKTVLSVNNLTSQSYESSLYDLETNSAKVVAAATSSSKSLKTIQNLNTPQHVLMIYTTGQDELYIPALRFPTMVKKDEVSKNIIVPLVKDALSNITVQPPHKPQTTLSASVIDALKNATSSEKTSEVQATTSAVVKEKDEHAASTTPATS